VPGVERVHRRLDAGEPRIEVDVLAGAAVAVEEEQLVGHAARLAGNAWLPASLRRQGGLTMLLRECQDVVNGAAIDGLSGSRSHQAAYDRGGQADVLHLAFLACAIPCRSYTFAVGGQSRQR